MSANTTFNGTIGVQNITDINTSALNTTNYTGFSLNETVSRFAGSFASDLAGSMQLSGVLLLGIMGFTLYKSDVGIDTSAAVMIPAVFFLATEGFLPFAKGIYYGMILVVAALAVFGVIKFADN